MSYRFTILADEYWTLSFLISLQSEHGSDRMFNDLVKVVATASVIGISLSKHVFSVLF